MITEIQFQKTNKYFINDEWIKIPIKPITILTGPNGSGKSTLMKFFKSLDKEILLNPIALDMGIFTIPWELRIYFDNGWYYEKSNGKLSIHDNSNNLIYLFDQELLLKNEIPFNEGNWCSAVPHYFIKKVPIKFLDGRIKKAIFDKYKYIHNVEIFDHCIELIKDNLSHIEIRTFDENLLENAINNQFNNFKYLPVDALISMESKLIDEELYNEIRFIIQEYITIYERSIFEVIMDGIKLLQNIDTSINQNEGILEEDFHYINSSTGIEYLRIWSTNKYFQLNDAERDEGHIFDINAIETSFNRVLEKAKPYKFRINDNKVVGFTIEDQNIAFIELSRGERKVLELLLVFHESFHGDGSSNILNLYYKYFNEPEIGLHPALQSRLAGLFFDFISKLRSKTSFPFLFDKLSDDFLDDKMRLNVCFIETHSEYLIRGLQLESAKRKKTEDVQILYFDGKGGITPINILEDGSLDKPFGPGFYDESERLAFLLLENKIKLS